jgi:hypothetical protein
MRILTTIAGVVTALLCFELLLTPLIGSSSLPEGGRLERRQYSEGIAVSTFEADGARSIGDEPVPAAPYGLLLGDSHVEAIQVSDGETAGAVISRLARESGSPYNVRQYGWPGVATPTYVAMADELISTWNPEWVAVVLNHTDVGHEPIDRARLWRMTVESDDSIQLVDVRVKVPPASGIRLWLRERGLTPSNVLAAARTRSSLAAAALQRYSEITGWGAAGEVNVQAAAVADRDGISPERIARASVRALKRAYGGRLLVVYTPSLGMSTSTAPDTAERLLALSCAAEGVEFVSLRGAMLTERDRNLVLCRGFHNSAPGRGHLHRSGNRVLGEAIWEWVSSRPHAGE